MSFSDIRCGKIFFTFLKKVLIWLFLQFARCSETGLSTVSATKPLLYNLQKEKDKRLIDKANATNDSKVGDYPIAVKYTENPNYTVTATGGNYSIDARSSAPLFGLKSAGAISNTVLQPMSPR